MESCVRFVTPPSSILMLFYSVASYPLAGQQPGWEVGSPTSQIYTSEIQQPSIDVYALLQGRVVGMTVLESGSMAAAGAQIRLRGNGSTSLRNQPVFYIDGVRLGSTSDLSGSLNDINPNDIELIEIVSGAAAVTQYGTDASEGVILIFTKRGRPGRIRWTAQVDQGFSRVLPFGPADIDWRSVADDDEVCPPDATGRYGDEPCDPSYLYMQPWLRNGWRQKYSLSAAGGSETVGYYMAGSFQDIDGVLPLDGERKYHFRGNFDFNPLENLAVSWSTSYTNGDAQYTPTGDNPVGLTVNVYRRDRNYLGSTNPDSIDQLLDWDITTADNRLITGITTRYAPAEHFVNTLTIGYDRSRGDMRSVRPVGFLARPQGYTSTQQWSSNALTFEYRGTLNLKLLDQFSYAFSWGGHAIVTNERTVWEYGVDSPPGDTTQPGTSDTVEAESRLKGRAGGVFVQNVFGYKNRLFLTVGGRADYTKSLGSRWLGSPQLFPKTSLSYVISDEPFWPKALGQIRLRFAYSKAGREFGLERLDPERTSEVELGFDAELLSNRLTLDFTYYRQKTSDAVFSIGPDPIVGFAEFHYESVGELDNRGIELAVGAAVLTDPHLGWEVGLYAFTNKSRMLDLGGAAPQALGSFGWLLPPDTLASGAVKHFSVPEILSDCMIASESDSTIQYYTSAVTGTPVEGNRCTHGPNIPTLTLGFNTTFRLPKGIQVVARGEYQGGHFVPDNVSYNSLSRSVKWPYCFEAYPQIEAGNEGNLSTWLQSTCIPGNVRSHWFVYPADFFKLRELSATVPVAAILPSVSDATLTLSARNVFRWRNKDFPVFDAEMMGDEGMNAPVRSIGHHVPLPATFTAFLRVGF